MFVKSIVILCFAAAVANGLAVPSESKGQVGRQLAQTLQDGHHRQHKVLESEERQVEAAERQLVPVDMYSINDWADSIEYWSRLMTRTVLPVVTDLMGSSAGRQTDFLRPITELLPDVAQFLHVASLILSALTSFLRDTAIALNSELPTEVQMAMTASQAARDFYQQQ